MMIELAALPLTLLSAKEKNKKVGGQAVIEGVMMRGKQKVSWAVRNPKGAIVVEKSTFVSVRGKSRILRWPVVRGALNLYESMALGYKALARSAEIATEEPAQTEDAASGESPATVEKEPQKSALPTPKKKGVRDTVAAWTSFATALLVSLGLFMFAPMWALSKAVPPDSAVLFNAFAGIVRVILFIGYLALISMWSEMRRIFEYHGAEHMAIFTYEDDKELTLENMRSYNTLHPRCGTSFLFLAMLLTIILFSIVDALIITFIAPYPNVAVRFVVHLALIPLVAGTSFEILKLSDTYKQLPIVGILIKPGLWLQKITTKKPDDNQLEVAAAALKAVL
jgi:uncharacterized protein YqhQ